MSVTHTEFSRNIGKLSVPVSQAVGVGGDRPSSTKSYQFGPFTQFALARDKTPAYKGWRDNTLSGEAIAHHLNRSTYANGVIGIIPAGYVVLDFDGPKAMQCLLSSQTLSCLERSTVWFSGDPKRGGLPKILYRLPEGIELPGKKLVTKFTDGNAVEILGPGHQVTLPGSFHSEERGHYQERGNYPVADAPEWLIELIGAKTTERRDRFDVANLRDVSEGDRSIEKLLMALDADDYDTWVEVGLSLKSIGDEYLDEFDQWSATGHKYKGFNEVEKKWSSFNPTKIKNGYAHLCRLAGVKPPSRVQLNQDERRDRYRGKINRVAAILGHTADSSEELAQLVISNLIVNGDRAAQPCTPITVNFSRRELHILDAPKGNGKTSTALKAVVIQALAQDKRVHVVTPTRILSLSAGGVLGIASHATPDINWKGFSAHVVCPESIHNWAHMPLGSVIIFDECDEVLERSLSAELVKSSKKLTTKEQLHNSLKLADTVVLSQDMVSNTAVDTVKALGGFNDDQVHYHLYDMPSAKRGKITVNLFSDWIDPLSTDFGHPGRQDGFKAWLNNLEADLKQGKRIYMPMGNRKKARALSRIIRRLYPDLKVVIFDGTHTFNSFKMQFAENPTQWVLDHQPDILIHTQVFNSGVSIECDYFDVSYEYGSALETAWAQSQRGERNRTSVFGGKLTERNVYISNQGCLVPDAVEQTLNVDLIAQRLEDELISKYDAATASGDNLVREIDLMHLIPYQARYEQLNKLGSYFKRDLLINEWQRREWVINEMPGESESDFFQALRDERARLNIQTASIRARAGRKRHGGIDIDRLKTMRDDQEERSPLARIRADKKSQVDILGIGFNLLNDEDWQLAWIDANDSPITIKKLQIRALVQLDAEQPGILDQLAQVTANAMVSCSGAILPIKNELIQTAKLMRSCPAVIAAIQGTLPDRWCRFDDVAIATKEWAINHADELTIQSRRTNRNGTAFQFTERTYVLDAVTKCLAIVGIEDSSAGTEGKNNIRYRQLKTVEDALKSLQKALAQEKDQLSIQTHQATVTRLETLDQTYYAVVARMRDRVAVGIGQNQAIELSREIDTNKVRSPHIHTSTPAPSCVDEGVVFRDFGSEGGGLGGRIVS